MKTSFIIFFALLPIFLMAQKHGKTHLFDDVSNDMIWFVQPEYQFTQLAIQNAHVAGLGIGFIKREHLVFEIKYLKNWNQITPLIGGIPIDLKIQQIGLQCQYVMMPQSKVHLLFPLSIGGGILESKSMNSTSPATLNQSKKIMYIEPGLQLEFNLHPSVKMDLGFGYRITSVSKDFPVASGDISGFVATAGFKIGRFEVVRNELKRVKRPAMQKESDNEPGLSAAEQKMKKKAIQKADKFNKKKRR